MTGDREVQGLHHLTVLGPPDALLIIVAHVSECRSPSRAQKSVQRPSHPKDLELPFCQGAKNFCVCLQCVWKGATNARISSERRIKSCETMIRRVGRDDTLVAEVHRRPGFLLILAAESAHSHCSSQSRPSNDS
jgi:hypothetical protein